MAEENAGIRMAKDSVGTWKAEKARNPGCIEEHGDEDGREGREEQDCRGEREPGWQKRVLGAGWQRRVLEPG